MLLIMEEEALLLNLLSSSLPDNVQGRTTRHSPQINIAPAMLWICNQSMGIGEGGGLQKLKEPPNFLSLIAN